MVAITNNVTFMDWIKLYHGRKYSHRYNFKIVLEATQDSSNIALLQRFNFFLEKMMVEDPRFMILPWKENSEEKPIMKPNQIPNMVGGLNLFTPSIPSIPRGCSVC